MERKTFENVVRQALYVTLARANGRTVSTTEAMDMLYDDERVALKKLANQHLDAAEASGYTDHIMGRLINEGSKPSDVAWMAWFLAPVLLGLLALVLGLGLTGGLMGLGVGLALVVLGYAMSAREIRARRIWRERKLNKGDAQETLAEMGQVLEGPAVSAALWVVVAVLLVGSVGYFAADRVINKDIYTLRAALKSGDATQAQLEGAYAGSDGVVSAEEAQTVLTAYGNETSQAVRLNITMAAIASVEDGFPEETAKEMAATQLSSGIVNSGCTADQLMVLLNFAGSECFSTNVYNQLSRGDFLNDGSVRAWVAAQPMAQLLAVYDGLTTGEKDVLAEIIFREPTEDVFVARIAELSDSDRLRCVCMRGAFITDPDEVLAYIRFGGSLGFTPTQIYPDGAKIDLATAKCDYVNETDTINDGLFLVMYRTEVKEQFEQLSTEPDEDYEYNNALGDAAYTVVLDTRALELLPAEMIPEKMEDCTNWIFIDSVWFLCGTLEKTTTTGYTYNESTTIRYIPKYAAVQRVSVFEAETGAWVYSATQELGYPPELPAYTGNINAKDYYIGEFNTAWPAEQEAILVDNLLTYNGNLLLLYYLGYAEE
ncbi:MAG: hypothetical protein IJE07_00465 [Clostridia bacterium]|nr:hypothetical protein [Clostridia bacterium]